MKTTLISRIYRVLQARENCKKDATKLDWFNNHDFTLYQIERNYLPHGSGINSGCTIEREFKKDCVILHVPYHNMDENGYYCGWSDFKIVCKPEFDGISLKIIGKDKYFVKDYLYDLFNNCLTEMIDFSPVN